jgi:hypothetical protein
VATETYPPRQPSSSSEPHIEARRGQRNDDDYRERWHGDDDDDDAFRPRRRPRRSRLEDARARVTGPAICLMVVGGLGVLFALGIMAFGILGGSGAFNSGARPPQRVQEDRTMMIIFLCFGLFLLVEYVCIFAGGLCMKLVKLYWLALLASILALLPCWGILSVLNIGAGIWSLIVLCNEDVRAAFREG